MKIKAGNSHLFVSKWGLFSGCLTWPHQLFWSLSGSSFPSRSLHPPWWGLTSSPALRCQGLLFVITKETGWVGCFFFLRWGKVTVCSVSRILIISELIFFPLPRYTILFDSTSLYQSWKKYIHHQKMCLQERMSSCWLPPQPRFWTHGKECVCKVIVWKFLDGWLYIEAGWINSMSKVYTLRDSLTLIQWRWTWKNSRRQ